MAQHAKTPRSHASSFELPPLPYAMDALEPHMSAKTLALHHDKHHRAYVEAANDLARGTAIEGMPLEQAVIESRKLGIGPLFNNIAQIYNHTLFWASMAPNGGGTPPAGPLLAKLSVSAGSFDAFKDQFVKAGLAQFGSGWVWLVDDGAKLEIVKTGNAETPLTDGRRPLLVCDVWEHAYYVDHENRREEYLRVFVDKLADWAGAERRMAPAGGGRGPRVVRVTSHVARAIAGREFSG